MANAGYSNTPLGRKLGYRAGQRVFVDAMPDGIRHAIEEDIGGKPQWLFFPEDNLEAAHIFVTQRSSLKVKLAELRAMIDPAGFVWVSWPKRSAGQRTDVTEDVIRSTILPDTDWVDVKVCAVDETWSALKLVIRKAARP